jgi:hypothetical protein
MKRSWVPVVAAAALSLAVAAPVAAASPIIDASMDKGSSAWAETGTCTDDFPEPGDYTCEYQSAYVFDGWSRYNGERFRSDALCVSSGTSVYHAATQTYEDFWTGGCLEDAGVVIDRNLAFASGAGIVPTESVSCTYNEITDEFLCTDPVPAGDVAVDLVWTGIPPVSKSTWHSRDVYGDCTSTSFSKGRSSEATVSGTIDGVPVPASFDWAQISSGKNHWTYSCHE